MGPYNAGQCQVIVKSIDVDGHHKGHLACKKSRCNWLLKVSLKMIVLPVLPDVRHTQIWLVIGHCGRRVVDNLGCQVS